MNNEIKYVPDEETEKSIMAEQIEIRKKALAKEAERAKRKLKENTDPDDDAGSDVTSLKRDSLSERLKKEKFTEAQRNELNRAIEDGLDEDYILSYAYPENTIVKMMAMRKNYMKDNQVEKGDGTL